jgi:hypothetical protein
VAVAVSVGVAVDVEVGVCVAVDVQVGDGVLVGGRLLVGIAVHDGTRDGSGKGVKSSGGNPTKVGGVSPN